MKRNRYFLFGFSCLAALSSCSDDETFVPAYEPPVEIDSTLTVTVNAAELYQTIDGFGASDAWMMDPIGNIGVKIIERELQNCCSRAREITSIIQKGLDFPCGGLMWGREVMIREMTVIYRRRSNGRNVSCLEMEVSIIGPNSQDSSILWKRRKNMAVNSLFCLATLPRFILRGTDVLTIIRTSRKKVIRSSAIFSYCS